MPKLKSIPLQDVDLGERFRKDYVNLEDLKSSISKIIDYPDGTKKERGLIHPITVSITEKGKYILLAGGRRFHACQELGWTKIPCYIFDPMDIFDRKAIESEENLSREDLSYAERASATRELHALYVDKYGESMGSSGKGHSKEDTANLLGVSRITIGRDIDLANAIDAIPELGECKNRAEALKMYDRMKEDMIKDELSQRYQARLKESGTDAALRNLSNSYIVGDFFDKVKDIPDRSVHLVEIDPPYGIDLKNIKKGAKVETMGYNEISVKDYPRFMERLVDEADRILMNDGWLLMWFANEPWTNLIYKILRTKGYELTRTHAIWNKGGGGQTHAPDIYLGSTYEPFYYARKGNAILYKQGRSNVFDYRPVTPNNKVHPTEKPIELYEEILSCFCPPTGRFVVAFLGSGNSLLAGANLSMKGIGYDLTKKYKDSYIVRVFEGKPGSYNSYGS